MTSSFHSQIALIERLQGQIHDVMAPLLAGSNSYTLFDFPDYNNVGDSAIFLGVLAYMRRHHAALPAYICTADHCDFRRLRGRDRDSLILINGGGNFGDLWPWTHGLREALLERFPGRRIIQLPQTIKFNSKTALARTREVIKRQGHFTLLVRDAASYQLATKEFDCKVLLCPDMAFYMGPLERVGPPEHDLVFLLRNDKERAPAREAGFQLDGVNAVVADWRNDGKPMRAARRLSAFIEAVAGAPASLADVDTLRNRYFERLARKRLERGLALLSSGGFLISDRLHAYILAVLLDLPRAVVDNSYGKISGLIETWMRDEDLVPAFKTLNDALEAWGSARPASLLSGSSIAC